MVSIATIAYFADAATGLSGDYQADWGVNAGFTHKFKGDLLNNPLYNSVGLI